MDFTFGIITTKSSNQYINLIINSIHKQLIPNYEIIIVGDCNIDDIKVKVIPFNENEKSGWITKKKNIICQQAKYENIVLIHDYILFNDDWYKGFLKFGNDFKYCVTRIETLHKHRFRDHVIFPGGIENMFQNKFLIPYDRKITDTMKRLLYISGSYYIIKKDIALKYPLNEYLTYAQGEDVELSQRLAKNNVYVSFNEFSKISLLKEKQQCSWEQPLTDIQLEYLLASDENDINLLFEKQCNHMRVNYLDK